MVACSAASPERSTASPRSVSMNTPRSGLPAAPRRATRSDSTVWSATETPKRSPDSASSATWRSWRTVRSCASWVSNCSVRQAISTRDRPNSTRAKIDANISDSRRRRFCNAAASISLSCGALVVSVMEMIPRYTGFVECH
jgi:hypothetical protein